MLDNLLNAESRGSFVPSSAHVTTRRYSVTRGRLHEAGETTNAGIACYVCEYACKHRALLDLDTRVLGSLAGQIIDQAVYLHGTTLWRWEATPSRADYSYPPDWDDTCKAIDAISAYEEVSGACANARVPSRDQLWCLLEQSLFERAHVGEDAKLPCDNNLALYMFMADPSVKKNNTEDIFVTAVTVRTFVATLGGAQSTEIPVIDQLLLRLIEAGRKGLANRLPFSALSRCYLSWGLFLLTLTDVAGHLPRHRASVRDLIAQYLGTHLFADMCGDPLWPYLVCDEVCYARLLSNGLDGLEREKLDETEELIGAKGLPRLGILYRHRRLGDIYGAAEWSGILDPIACSALSPVN